MKTRPTSSRRSSGERRLRIIRKAAELFRERGYHGVTVDEIAKAVGVSKLSVYYYLESKEEILYEIHRMAHTAVLKAWQDAIAEEGSASEQLRRALIEHIDIMCSEMSFTTSMFFHLYDLPSRRRRLIVKLRDEVDSIARELIRKAVHDGEFVNCDPSLITLAIFGSINYMPYWYRPSGRLSKQEIVAGFVDYFMRALLQPNGRVSETNARPSAVPVS